MAETREPQYQVCFDVLRETGRASFGLMSNQVWHEDPKRLGFLLARYKFVAKMFSFSMNDEVVHTGFHAMAHYLIALGCNKKGGG